MTRPETTPAMAAALLDRAWTAADYEPRTSFPRAISPAVRRAELAHAVEIACARCEAARAELPMKRVTR